MIQRRTVLLGLAGSLAAPVIVRAHGLMSVRLVEQIADLGAMPNNLRVAIVGWEALDAEDRIHGIVPLHLPASWRSSYL